MIHEWTNNVNVNTMNGRNIIKLIYEIIKWSKHEMHKYITCIHFKKTIHQGREIITNMYTTKIMKEGWNNHSNLDDLGLTCCTRKWLVINNKNYII